MRPSSFLPCGKPPRSMAHPPIQRMKIHPTIEPTQSIALDNVLIEWRTLSRFGFSSLSHWIDSQGVYLGRSLTLLPLSPVSPRMDAPRPAGRERAGRSLPAGPPPEHGNTGPWIRRLMQARSVRIPEKRQFWMGVQLLGRHRVETTMIDTHVMWKTWIGVNSPRDG